MENYQLKMILLAILAILILTLANCGRSPVSAPPQNSPQISRGGGDFNAPRPDPTHGKAAGELLPFNPVGEDLRASLLAHPAPVVWLVFPASTEQVPPPDKSTSNGASTMKVELPADAKKVLLSYWKFLLAVQPDTPDIDMNRARENARQELNKIEMNAPKGKRKIAWDEADKLVEFLEKSVADIFAQVKKYKQIERDISRSATPNNSFNRIGISLPSPS